MIPIAILGDSIAAGYGDHSEYGNWPQRMRKNLSALFPQDIEPPFWLFNLSVPGDNTYLAMQRFGELILNRKTSGVIIALGINDLIISPNHAKRITPGQLQALYQFLAVGLRRFFAKFIVLAVLPVEEQKLPLQGTMMNWRNTDIVEYNAAMEKTCASLKIPFMGQAELFPVGAKDFTWDGVHAKTFIHDHMAGQVLNRLQTDGWFESKNYPNRPFDTQDRKQFLDILNGNLLELA